MAGQTVVKQVTAEIRAKTDELDAALQRSEGKLKNTKRQIEGAGGAAATVGRQYGRAATQIASATEAIARNGRITGESAKQLLQQGSAIAFAFGPAGAIVGALSIFGLAVATAMGRARAEVKELAEGFDEELRILQSRLDYRGSGSLLTRALVGDPRAKRRELQIPFEEFEREVISLRERVARGSVVPLGEQGGLGIAAERKRLSELEPILEERRRQIEKSQKQFDEDARREQERLANERASAEEQRQLNEERARVDRARTEAQRNEIRAREELQREALEFGRDFDRTVLAELGSEADLIAARFDELIGRGIKVEGADSPRVQQLIALKDSAVAAAQAISQSQETLRDLDLLLATSGQPTAQTFESLSADAERLRAELARLTTGSKEYLAVQQQLLAVEQKRDSLLKGIGASGGSGAAATRTTADLAREIQQAVDGALQLAQAFGNVDAAVIGILRSVGQVAGNLPALQKALNIGPDAVKGGKVDALGVIGAGLPIVGALATIASSFLGDSPQEEARRAVIERNTDALKELTAKAGLLGIGISGTASQSASSGLRAFFADPAARIAAQFDARGAARAFGLSLPELDRIAAQFGITLDGGIESFIQLQEALATTSMKLGEFGTDLDSATRQAETEIDLYGITDPREAARIRNNAFAGRSPLVDELLSFDLNTPEGRAAARAFGLKIFETLKAGDGALTEAQLGGLDGDELLAFLDQFFAGLDAIDAAEGITTTTATQADRVVTADRTQITSDQASRILGLSSAQLAVQREIRDLLATARQAATTPLPVPSASVFAAPAGGASGGITVTVNMDLNVWEPITGQELGVQVSDALVDALNRALGQRVTIARLNSGKAVRS